jgi:hypothetical protein
MWLAVVGLGAAASCMALVSSAPYGLGITPDSLYYMAAAESLAHGNGYCAVSGEPMAFWPPLYSLVLAIGPALDVPVLVFARWLHAGLAGALVVALGGFLLGRLRWWPLAILAVAVCMMAQPMVLVQSFAWSEPLFNLITLVTLASLSAYLTTGRRRDLIVSAIAAGLMCLTRYPGVVILPLAVVCIGGWGPGGRRQRWAAAASFGAFAWSPFAAWLLRNLLVVHSLAGPRRPATTTFAASLEQVCRTIDSWLLPRDFTRLSDHSVWLSGGTALVIVSGVAALVINMGFRRDGGYADRRRYVSSVVPWLLFIPAYVGFMLVFASLTAIDPLGSRYLSPVFIAALVALVLAFDRLLHRATPATLGKPAQSVRLKTALSASHGLTALKLHEIWKSVQENRQWQVALAMSVLLLAVAEQGKKTLCYLAREGQGFTSRGWQQRSLFPDIAALPRDGLLWSSQPSLVRSMTGREAGVPPESPEAQISMTGGWSWPTGKTVYFVWFNDEYPAPLHGLTPQELQGAFDVEPYVARRDGTIYRLHPRIHVTRR